jgi:hypothetical protein
MSLFEHLIRDLEAGKITIVDFKNLVKIVERKKEELKEIFKEEIK